MLDLDRTRITNSISAPIQAKSLTDEGMCMIISGNDSYGNPRTTLSAGASTEVFYGVSLFERRSPEFFWGAPVTGQQANTAVANTSAHTLEDFVKDSDSAFTGTSDPAETLDNAAITVSDAGVVSYTAASLTSEEYYAVQWYRKPDLIEQETLTGTSISLTPVTQGANVGIATAGVFYTNYVHTNGIYKIGNQLYTAADGRFTTNTSGKKINAYVVKVPTASDPFLGFELFNNA